jgi:ubiquinone/menaquinone biosynthesis C-methylase UbiE
MVSFRAFIKEIFYKLKLAKVLDQMLYLVSRLANWADNSRFKKENPTLIIPPDYFIYETYRLNYKQFFKDGEATAREIIQWTKSHVGEGDKRILDWGCGVSRIAMHIGKLAGTSSAVYACDINEKMISFNAKSYKDITYSLISYKPPTKYENGYFDLIYGLSIFTHIDDTMQEEWICEMYRILKENGIFLFTTQGRYFNSKLLPFEKQLLAQQGVFSKTYQQKGHRMMSTYNEPEFFKNLLEKYFEVLEFHAGEVDQSKVGGQDLWIVRKSLPGRQIAQISQGV